MKFTSMLSIKKRVVKLISDDKIFFLKKIFKSSKRTNLLQVPIDTSEAFAPE